MTSRQAASEARRIQRPGRVTILPPGDGITAWGGSARRPAAPATQTPLSHKGIKGNPKGGYPCPSKPQ